MKNRVLVIAAHPDDEALGCSGTIAKHTQEKDQVYVIFMSNGVSSRAGANLKSATKVRVDSANKSCKVLKTEEPIFLDFPDNKMDSIPLLVISGQVATKDMIKKRGVRQIGVHVKGKIKLKRPAGKAPNHISFV